MKTNPTEEGRRPYSGKSRKDANGDEVTDWQEYGVEG